jgi:hypothetical protein
MKIGTMKEADITFKFALRQLRRKRESPKLPTGSVWKVAACSMLISWMAARLTAAYSPSPLIFRITHKLGKVSLRSAQSFQDVRSSRRLIRTCLLSSKDSNTEKEEWRALLSAFQMYKAAYGDLRIPSRFVVPSMPPWPGQYRPPKREIRTAS